jgi:hypothetical protein
LKRALVAALVVAPAIASAGEADDERLTTASIIYARGTALFKSDARGKSEVELAQLPTKTAVRALRTDADAKTLLVDLGGKWSWMPLDGKATTLTELPCADGPAQLANDGACVICRGSASPNKSVIVQLQTGKVTPIEAPPMGARLVGLGGDRKLVWADAAGVWSSPPGNLKAKKKVAPDAPLRGFLPSPDGSRAAGVYTDIVHDSPKTTKPADILMTFALDGEGARRKTIKASIPVEWSYDNEWLLVQDGAAACVAKASGGQYKCWKGYTAASIAPDGAYALLLGNRDRAPEKKKKPAKKSKPDPRAEPSDEPEQPEDQAAIRASARGIDDVAVPPPSGPLALYRAKLEGAFTERPTLVVKVVEGSAVWLRSK